MVSPPELLGYGLFWVGMDWQAGWLVIDYHLLIYSASLIYYKNELVWMRRDAEKIVYITI